MLTVHGHGHGPLYCQIDFQAKAFHMRVGFNCKEKCHLCMAQDTWEHIIAINGTGSPEIGI